jgi:lysozyme family protein
MTDKFKRSIKILLEFEGSEFTNDPKDRGGATKYGITQRVYDAWSKRKGQPSKTVAEITLAEVYAIYFEEYWDVAKCEKFAWPLCYFHFDAAVNHSPKTAWIFMQRALGVEADGAPGKDTWGAFALADEETLVFKWLKIRAKFYIDIVKNDYSQIKYLNGWIGRRVIEIMERTND